MEWQLNLAMGAVLAALWLGQAAQDPVATASGSPERLAELAALEDAHARDRDDVMLARQLSRAYLEMDRPGLAVAALRSGPPELLQDPVLAHRLAQAYEGSGRLLDALATSELALARCARVLGTSPASAVTPVPRHECAPGMHAVLEIHHRALQQMTAWGVADPRRDPRARLAYDLAMRRARIASFGR